MLRIRLPNKNWKSSYFKMAQIGTDLMTRVVGHTEAERAFRPWWDIVEDYIIYALAMIGIWGPLTFVFFFESLIFPGVVLIPTAPITGSPLDCQYCIDNFCNIKQQPFQNNKNLTTPSFSSKWVAKLCTHNGTVDDFLLYYPYFIVCYAFILFGIERIFIMMYEAKFYTFNIIFLKFKISVSNMIGKLIKFMNFLSKLVFLVQNMNLTWTSGRKPCK